MSSSRSRLFVLAAALLGLAATASADVVPGDDNAWVIAAKARSDSDISLWTRVIPGAELKAFRGATHVQVPLESAVAFFNDVPSMPKWIFRCKEARVLAEMPDGTKYIHLKIDGLWPLEDRDAVIKATSRYVSETGDLQMLGVAAPDYLPKQEGYIRIPAIETTWNIRATDDNQLRVQFSGHVDPAGSVPRWLANALVTMVPRYTLKHMHDLVVDPKWQQAEQRQLGARLLERVKHATP